MGFPGYPDPKRRRASLATALQKAVRERAHASFAEGGTAKRKARLLSRFPVTHFQRETLHRSGLENAT